jgi:assimilatory nitrate reductase catalytic subunit
MTRTGLVPRLTQHVAAPLASIHPADATALGIEEAGLLRLESAHGTTVLRATLDPAQRLGEVFVPMHWTDAFSSAGPIGQLVTGACDPVSGQPELKATPVRAVALPTHWRGLLLHAHAVRPEGCIWSRIPLEHGHAFDLAGAASLPEAAELAAFARNLLAAHGTEVMEMADPSRGTWRYAALRNGRLTACLYLTSRGAALPSHQALAALMAGPVAEAARRTVLAGGGSVSAAEKLVCACFSIGLETLRAAVVDRRLTSVAEIGAALRAGTNCGSCIPELREILRDQLAPA